MASCVALLMSIRQTLSYVIDSPKISLCSPSNGIDSLWGKIENLLTILDSPFYEKEKVDVLLREIEEPVRKLEDALDSLISKQQLSQSSESLGDDCRYASTTFTLDLKDLDHEIDSFTRIVQETKERYRAVSILSSKTYSEVEAGSVSEDEDDDDDDSSDHPPIGIDDQYGKLINLLISSTDEKTYFPWIGVFGMAGIGKTTLVKLLYEDLRVLDYFECRAWLSLRSGYPKEEIHESLVNQLDPDFIHQMANTSDHQKVDLPSYLSHILESKRCLIVLDGVWDRGVLQTAQECIQDYIESRFIFTTRILDISWFSVTRRDLHIDFLNQKHSWQLLSKRVFDNKSCPYELEQAGKKITELCGGLPLLIILVANHIRKAENLTPEYWSQVAEDGIAFIIEADKKFSKRLLSSYNYLPPQTKFNFLYLGVFPLNYEISTSKLDHLWKGEGFFYQLSFSKDYYKECLNEVRNASLLLVRKQGFDGEIKTCVLHQAYHPLCVIQARKERFYNVINGKASISPEAMENQRRLCIYNNALFGIKDVHNSMSSVSTNVRSLLCTGQHHPYPVPMFLSFDLLKVLDALTIHFYEFPVEILKFVLLMYLAFTYNRELPASISKLQRLHTLIVSRDVIIKTYGAVSYMPTEIWYLKELIHLKFVLLMYLAFTYNRELPASISKLQRLHTLIVSRDVIIKTYGAVSYMPTEIWYLKELIHLQVTGSALPNPPHGESLPKLLTLLDVNARSCTEEVLDGAPKLEKLGIEIDDPLCCFDHLAILNRLRSLKFTIVNPNPIYQVVPSPELVSNIPKFIRKLSLSGFGYPWNYMSKIATLPMLEVLKLREYAFRGSKWEVNKGGFLKLKVLFIEDTDLEHLRADFSCLRLECLDIRHCYKLKDIDFKGVTRLKMIELVDCGTAAKKNLEERGLGSLLRVHSSAENF